MTEKMIVMNIDPTIENYDKKKNEFNNQVGKGKHIFLFLYMDNCGPCNLTKPKWDEIEKKLKEQQLNNNDIVIAKINQKLFNDLKNIGKEPMGFPSLRYINSKKTPNFIEEYEDSSIENKDRTSESFANWIETKMEEPHYKTHKNIKKQMGGSTRKNRKKRGGKWSMKYKKSINCRKPKGFSQKQHCKYGRKNWKK